MNASPAPMNDTAKPSWGLWAFLYAPVLVYAGGLAYSITREQGTLHFEFIDWLLLYTILGYLFTAVLVAGTRKRAISFAFLLVSSVLTLGAVELFVRFVLMPPILGGVPRAPGSRQEGKVTDGLPGLSGVEYTFSTNSMGLRSPEVRPESCAVRILTVGGSTTECMYIPDERSWPWRLQTLLAERLGKSVFVGNAGHGGHNTLHHEYQIRNYDLVPQFQWVVVLCGYNDLETDEEYHSTLKIDETALTPTEDHKAFYRSMALIRILHRVFLFLNAPHVVGQDPKADWVLKEREERQRSLKLNTIREIDPDKLEKHVAYYRSNLQKIIQAARVRGVKLLFLTQPSLYRKDMPPELDSLLWMCVKNHSAATPEYLEKVLDAYNQAMKDLCRKESVDCLDLASLLPKDTTVFYDDCHFNISGCEKIASLLTDFFAKKFAGR